VVEKIGEAQFICRRGRAQLILAGQVNHVVGEVELHFVKREVREGDLLRVDGFPLPSSQNTVALRSE
jgi:hypothetical protein